MNKTDLVELLEGLAQKDLEPGESLFDHPCSVAVRAIEQSFSDIKTLQTTININLQNKSGLSKRVQMLTGLSYNPTY